ncbi:hypothetical protein M413DRAFT_269711 [Hebeloma cylindrosporum]|uniref:Uncharacterized protein n=1 Tax=Hebeloma cylindrosporum TaxID=76867 RepID=A0A0C2Z1Q3_HEBCY|nr:hypothetical protein M413DRAFT_269711 [Hebeloma cylindrosporum h7]
MHTSSRTCSTNCIDRGATKLDKVTSAYTAIRRPTATSFVVGSRDQRNRYEFNAPGFEDIQEGDNISPERLSELGKSMEEGWDLPWNNSARDDIKRALDML